MRTGWMNGWAGTAVVIAWTAAVPARAAVDAAAEVSAAVYAASATQAAFAKAADAKLTALKGQITALTAQVRAGKAKASELTAAQDRLVADLAEKDRAYAQAIAQFRGAVTEIASTPEGAAALARYNSGDEVGALAELDRLQAADEASRHKMAELEANIQDAVGERHLAQLALDTRDKGKLGTDAVIARYERVTKLDPGVHWDWVQLDRLYQDAGRLPDARRAAEAAARTASDDRDRSVALNELGDIDTAQGDLAGARKAYEEGLDTRRRLAAADPSNAGLQRDIWVSLWRFAKITGSGVTWAQVLAALEDADHRGLLAPSDRPFLDQARRNAAAAPAP